VGNVWEVVVGLSSSNRDGNPPLNDSPTCEAEADDGCAEATVPQSIRAKHAIERGCIGDERRA
jgi:hypothetical protein